jgi:phytoene synthase
VTPDDYCADKARRNGSSLHYALLWASPEQRRAATAVHAFGRELREVVFECSDLQVARAKLAWWRQEIEALFRGSARHPITRALQPAVELHRLPASGFDKIIDGAETELVENRHPDFAALAGSCQRKAGVVAQLCAEIFSYRDTKSVAAAHDLGLAIQLAQVIRDVGVDARRNRVYLPMDDMARFRVRPTDLLHGKSPDGMAPLIEFVIDRVQGCLAHASAELPKIDRRSQRPYLILAGIHRAVLDEIRADGCRVLDRRTALTPLRKLWIALKTQ